MKTEEDWSRKYDSGPGAVWICNACGKRATNRANGGLSYGWDESCFMNAILCEEVQRDGEWIPIEEKSDDKK